MSMAGMRGAACVTVLLLLAGGGCRSESGAKGTAAAPQAKVVPVHVDLTLPPVATFDEVCSRCHGPGGSMHLEQFARLTDAELVRDVERMMTGPGRLEPSEADTAAMVAYHRALAMKQSFVCLVNGAAVAADDKTTLHGELWPGGSVQVVSGDQAMTAEVNDTNWSLVQPSAQPFEVIAASEQGEAHFTFPPQQWSHARP